jgi:hypothetical protein
MKSSQSPDAVQTSKTTQPAISAKTASNKFSQSPDTAQATKTAQPVISAQTASYS